MCVEFKEIFKNAFTNDFGFFIFILGLIVHNNGQK